MYNIVHLKIESFNCGEQSINKLMSYFLHILLSGKLLLLSFSIIFVISGSTRFVWHPRWTSFWPILTRHVLSHCQQLGGSKWL